MIYQAYVGKKLWFEASSFAELLKTVIKYHQAGDFYDQRPVPDYSKVCSVDEDDNETLYDAVGFTDSVKGQV